MVSSADLFGVNRARAAAKSFKTNPRNLELVWYPFWNRAAFRIASAIDCHRLTVAPQYPLWRIWTKDDVLGDIVIHDEGRDQDSPMDQSSDGENDPDDDDDYDGAGNTTISTIGETLNVKTRSRITDFALIWWDESDVVNPMKDDDLDEEFDIEQEFIPVLVEVKRSPSRTLDEQRSKQSQNNNMLSAQKDVFRQALYFFANHRWSHQKSILVIAAVGDFWTYTVVSRSGGVINSADEEDPDWEPSVPDVDKYMTTEWSDPVIWGSEEGNSDFDVVKEWLQGYFLKEEVERCRATK